MAPSSETEKPAKTGYDARQDGRGYIRALVDMPQSEDDGNNQYRRDKSPPGIAEKLPRQQSTEKEFFKQTRYNGGVD